jgi:hypothetical protein
VVSTIHLNEKSTTPNTEARFALVAYMGIEDYFWYFNMIS